MFSSTLSDRLKAAVNQLEATGAAYQQRAFASRDPSAHPSASASSSNLTSIPSNTNTGSVTTTEVGKTEENQDPSSAGAGPAAGSGDGPAFSSPSKPHSVFASLSLPSSPALVSSGSATSPTSPSIGIGHSPTRSSTSQLAENALSGLRKSFHFRSSMDGNHHPSHPNSTQASSNLTQKSTSGLEKENDRILGEGKKSGEDGKIIGISTTATVNGSAEVTFPVTSDPATIPLPASPNPTTSDLPPVTSEDPLTTTRLPQLRVDTESPASPSAPTTVIQSLSKLSEEPTTTTTTSDSTPVPPAPLTTNTEMDSPPKPDHVPDDQLRTAYETLASQVAKAEAVFKALTPLESGAVRDVEALEGWIRMVTGKVEVMTEELRRLQSKLDLQESRMEELRDTHRLESQSQSELITKLRGQLTTAENNFSAKAAELMTMGQLRSDLAKAQTQAKEEEEKRTKAISLLKTVRQKLVKVEKEKEEIERDRAEERAERSRAIEEAERMRMEREREVTNLRKGFERELNSAKERYEKDLSTKKAAWELEMITTKASHAKELSNKATKITGLEAIVKELNATKNEMFDTIQAKQEESETARTEMESLQTRTKELEFQLREALERNAILEDASRQANSNGSGFGERSATRSISPAPSGQSIGEVQRLLAESESRAEVKLSELRSRIRSLEKERNELEEEWASKLQERVRELEKLRRIIRERDVEYADVLKMRREKEARIEELEVRKREMEKEMNEMKVRIESVKGDVAVAAEAERIARDEITNLQIQISTLQTQLEDSKSTTTQLRATNKTLRDELRKVQSSVTLLERQRNPGVGYWAGDRPGSNHNYITNNNNNGSTNTFSPIVGGGGITSPTKSSEPVLNNAARMSMESVVTSTVAGTDKGEEEVNLEYLRNVIIQFLEHKEMRPNLVRVMSVILRFTPQELRRLNAKLLT